MFYTNDIFREDRHRLMRRLRAFTLIEVTLAMAILALLAGALYAMVDATIRATSELNTRQNRSQQVRGLIELCHKTFRSLPVNSTMEVRIVEQRQNYVPEIVFRNAPGLFTWGEPDAEQTSTILGVRPQVGGLVSLSLLQDSDQEIGSYLLGGSPKQPWLPLITGLRKVEWRLYDPRTGGWLKEWKEPSFRPALVELTLTLEEGVQRYVFWVPPVQRQQP